MPRPPKWLPVSFFRTLRAWQLGISPSAIHFNCSLRSCAVWKRSSGFLARQVATTCSNTGGVRG